MPARIWRRGKFGAQVDFEAEQLVGLGDALGDDDLGDAEVDLGEVVDGDERGARRRAKGLVGLECLG